MDDDFPIFKIHRTALSQLCNVGIVKDFSVLSMLIDEKMKDELEKKLKRERIEICLNCEKFAICENIGKFELCHCPDFVEVEGEGWVIKKIHEL